jgi:hypothetical protein
MTTRLDTPVLDDGIQFSNWFQGRLLAAEDLQTEQTAARAYRDLLGRAIGPGVIHGLSVEWPVTEGNDGSPEAATRVRITRGAAINRRGQLVRVGTDVVIPLSAAGDDSEVPEAGLFRDCPRDLTSAPIDGDGVALLVMRPASGYRERAPASGLESAGKVAGCGDRYAVEGASFRLVPWTPSAPAGTDPLVDILANPASGTPSLLRNRLAHRFLGSDTLPGLGANPLLENAATADPGPLGDLRRDGSLDDCDVPLALVYWPAGGIAFVDAWPVRRMPSAVAPDALLAPFLSPAVTAVGQARLLQFQRQLGAMLAQSAGGTAANIQALRDFQFVPPLFVLPIHPGAIGEPALAGSRGVAPLSFFNGVPTRPLRGMDGALLGSMIQRSLTLPAVDLDRGEVLYVFRTTENATPGAQPQFVITSHRLDTAQEAVFDGARFAHDGLA